MGKIFRILIMLASMGGNSRSNRKILVSYQIQMNRSFLKKKIYKPKFFLSEKCYSKKCSIRCISDCHYIIDQNQIFKLETK